MSWYASVVGVAVGVLDAEAHLAEPEPDYVDGDVAGVLHPVDVTDLIAVVRRDRHLGEALLLAEQTQDDLGVEVEVVRVGLEVEVGEGVDPVGAVPAVPLAEVESGHGVLDAREDLVADELVERHAALAGVALDDHPGAEDRVCIAGQQRGHQVLDALRRVLAVGVQQHHHVQSPFDGPAVAGLLVAAVPEVLLVADHGQRQGRPGLELQADLVGAVRACVVAHQDMVDRLHEPGGQSRQRGGERGGRVVGDDQHTHAGSLRLGGLRMSDELRCPGRFGHAATLPFRGLPP